jgi:Fe-S cluster assembly protein SufD
MKRDNPAHIVSVMGDSSFDVAEGQNATIILLPAGPGEMNLTVHLKGEGARVKIFGFVVGKKQERFVIHTLQHHEAKDTTSNLLVKSILFGSADVTYAGEIRVEPEAQKTDAYQRNENLLLSSLASTRSKPGLEILANDVRCTHGATVGTIDEEQLFYLESRGIPDTLAKELIIEGFFESALQHISDTIALTAVRSALWKNLHE